MWLKGSAYLESAGVFSGPAGGSAVPISLQFAGLGAGGGSAGASPGLLSVSGAGALLSGAGERLPAGLAGRAGVLSVMSVSLLSGPEGAVPGV